METIHFRLMVGVCHLYPDHILVARSGSPAEVNLRAEERRIGWFRLLYAALTCYLWYVAAAYAGRSPAFSWLVGAWGLFFAWNVFRSVGISSSARIERAYILSVTFVQGIRYLTRPRFVIRFVDRKGRLRHRLLNLPGSLNGRDEAMRQALEAMRRAGYYPWKRAD